MRSDLDVFHFSRSGDILLWLMLRVSHNTARDSEKCCCRPATSSQSSQNLWHLANHPWGPHNNLAHRGLHSMGLDKELWSRAVKTVRIAHSTAVSLLFKSCFIFLNDPSALSAPIPLIFPMLSATTARQRQRHASTTHPAHSQLPQPTVWRDLWYRSTYSAPILPLPDHFLTFLNAHSVRKLNHNKRNSFPSNSYHWSMPGSCTVGHSLRAIRDKGPDLPKIGQASSR